MNKVRIAHNPTFQSQTGAEELSTMLQGHNVDSSLISTSYGNTEILLSENEVDIVIVPLEEFPVVYDKESITIAGLSERKSPGYSLLIKEDSVDKVADFRLKNGSKILANNSLVAAQLTSINPTLHVIQSGKGHNDSFQQFIDCEADAMVVSQLDSIEISKEFNHLHLVHLHPREIIPQAGSGVIAWVTHSENIELKRLLNKIHNKETALATNIERTALKLSSEQGINDICAYCYTDLKHFYHLIIAMKTQELVKQTFSQSTSANLAQLAIKTLTI